MLVLPILTYQFVGLLGGSADLRLFGFIYGSIPTASGVLLYAQQYGIGVERTAIAMVMCTIMGAPLVRPLSLR